MANFQSYLYDHVDFITESCTWTKPSNINEDKPILVHVYGSGGSGADKYNFGAVNNNGGGGGGLAVKLIDVSSLGATETITIGAVDDDPRNQSATTSFGSHCSASGGNGGTCETANQGSNSGVDGTANYGVGGKGIGGDVNKRGGTGGVGYYNAANNAGGGGGGSAPAPYGISDGFRGGNGYTYSGGGGAGIGGPGQDVYRPGRGNGYHGGSGGGSMNGDAARSYSTQYTASPGSSGLNGAGVPLELANMAMSPMEVLCIPQPKILLAA